MSEPSDVEIESLARAFALPGTDTEDFESRPAPAMDLPAFWRRKERVREPENEATKVARERRKSEARRKRREKHKWTPAPNKRTAVGSVEEQIAAHPVPCPANCRVSVPRALLVWYRGVRMCPRCFERATRVEREQAMGMLRLSLNVRAHWWMRHRRLLVDERSKRQDNPVPPR